MTDGTKSLEQRRCGSSMRSTPIASCSATIPTNGSLRAEFANTRRGPSVDAACPRGAEGRHASGGRGHSGRGTPPGWGSASPDGAHPILIGHPGAHANGPEGIRRTARIGACHCVDWILTHRPNWANAFGSPLPCSSRSSGFGNPLW
jgi:hypothetical protein